MASWELGGFSWHEALPRKHLMRPESEVCTTWEARGDDPAVPLLGVDPKKMKPASHRDLHTQVHCSTVHSRQAIEATWWSPTMKEGTKRVWRVCTMEYYSAVSKKGTLQFVSTWMELQGVWLNEIRGIEKDKYCTVSLTCGIEKEKKRQIRRNRE